MKMNGIKVQCIKESKNFKEVRGQIGEIFIMNLDSLFADCDGDWYANFYDIEGNIKGHWRINRFIRIE